jgi:hypothetical protein
MRILALAAGVAGAAAFSQYPEFSQQYIQRLAGQVDALTLVVADFDKSAAANNLTRDAALAELQGTAFLTSRRADMQATFDRQQRLSDNLTFLRLAAPMERIAMPHRLADPETFAATWSDFRPALPLTPEGGLTAGIGFLGGYGALSGLIALLFWPFRRRRTRWPRA